jgi:hypothetical protein
MRSFIWVVMHAMFTLILKPISLIFHVYFPNGKKFQMSIVCNDFVMPNMAFII